ncbi:DUF6226 family protein [Paenarthrobacter nitroguajacolicus]|uniref:DUF6226 family protein n=1 Tax=Paenarthrobacter nitroguajacolicus TaxID=211146 RepID=UPI003BEEB3D6
MGDMEGLFDGPASGLPASLSSKNALYRPASEDEAPVKHLAGYAPFMVFCQSSGVPAENLAIDVASLLAFLRTNVNLILRDPKLRDAATIFVGNVIVSMRPEADWRVMADGSREAGDRGTMITVDRLFDGFGIQYGNRWGGESPPEDSYRVETHVERFEGLHKVARSLLEYLESAYNVDVSLDPAHAMEVSLNTVEVIAVARLTPRDPPAAPLTFVWTSFPGDLRRLSSPPRRNDSKQYKMAGGHGRQGRPGVPATDLIVRTRCGGSSCESRALCCVGAIRARRYMDAFQRHQGDETQGDVGLQVAQSPRDCDWKPLRLDQWWGQLHPQPPFPAVLPVQRLPR